MRRAYSPCLKRGSLRSPRPLLPRSSLRRYASVTDLSIYPQPGETLHGFTLQRAKHVPELQLTALHLQHDKTGAEYLHLARDDQNNVFSIGFKTNPPDATGVPHILEHTTLCGSKKYPVRDPFFKMLPRSLSNFMNAMTSSDHTTYPFATTNRQDFRNLMSVYLDATLHPLLNAEDFAQEGWRIGPENPLAASSDGQGQASNKVVFKGVVYNEMKGQMSDASYLYYIRFQDHIFPSINNSGGDPQKMTDLTYEQLKRFHADHYHPSGAKILTYGDIPLSDHLREVDARLRGFDKIIADSVIKSPNELAEGPYYVTVKGPIDPLVPQDMQYKTSTTWLMCDTSNVLETFSLSVLSSLLLDGYGSPLYRALIESGLGPDWSSNTGFDGSAKIGMFSVGLNGVKADDVPKVRETLMTTLRELKDKGFDKSKIDGILHQIELSLKHKTAQFGLGVVSRLNSSWFNGVDPFNALAWEETVSAFKSKFASGGYLEGLLQKYLLNDKTLTFTMEPSPTYAAELGKEEARRLKTKITEASKGYPSEEEARKALGERELELLKVQEAAKNQDLSCLPSVHVDDIPRYKEPRENRESSLGHVAVQWREAPTNGLTYFRAINLLNNLPENLRELVPLFTDAIMRLGTKDKTVEQLEDLIKLKTGGLRVGYHATTSPLALNTYEEGLTFSGFALDRNVSAMYELLRAILFETNFDGPDAESQIRQLLQSSASGAVDAVASSGHSYARRFAEAGLTPQGRLQEQVRGLAQVKLTTSLASRPASEGLGDVIEKLKTIQSMAISNTPKLRTALTCGAESVSTNEAALQQFLGSLPSDNPKVSRDPLRSRDHPQQRKTFFALPYQVSYTAHALSTVPYTHHSSPPLQILSQLLTHKHLHREIREKGGAYGGGAYTRGLGGIFGFYSYRDPNPQNTMNVIADVSRWAVERQWTDEDIEQAKLSVFQGLDAPESVSEEGMVKFLSGVDDAMRQRRREALLDVVADDVRAVAQEYLVEGKAESCVAVLGEKKEWVGEGWDVRDLGIVAETATATAAAVEAAA